MTVWEDVLSAALVGTQRRPFRIEQLDGLVDPASVDARSAEAAVLSAAAVVGTWRRAGRRPASLSTPTPDPAPPDARPPCSPAAAQLLELLLAGHVKLPGGNHRVIAEWLDASVRAGRRPPEGLLVPLLALGTDEPGLRASVAQSVGPRGRWLARVRDEWAWMGTDGGAHDLADRFATAPRAARAAILASLRRDDPAAGRALLASTWDTEAAAERAGLLGALAEGLGDEDEPFLEAALDDRAASVRAVAAALLDRLPSSRRAGRMAERAVALVSVAGRFRKHIEVELPDEIDAAAKRDGVAAAGASPAGEATKVAALRRIVAGTPLAVWERHLGLEPEDAVRLAEPHPELLAGWEAAAVAQRDERWAAALARVSPNPMLFAVVGPQAAAAAFDVLVRSRTFGSPELVALIAGMPGPWSPELSSRIAERLPTLQSPYLVSAAAPALADNLDPSSLPHVEAWIGGLGDDAIARRARELAHALSIRQTIHEELA